MRILSLDTAAAQGSIALVQDGEVARQVVPQAPGGFGAVIFREIESFLADQKVELHDIDLFAGGAGPGSFTGIRVGLTVVKGLATVLGRPCVGVSNLQALAALGTAPLRAVVLDARRGEIYGAVYDARLAPIAPEVVAPLQSWLANLPKEELEFVTPDFPELRTALAATRFANAPLLEGCQPLAGAIGRIAYARALANQIPSTESIDANYVRRSDAELFWKDA